MLIITCYLLVGIGFAVFCLLFVGPLIYVLFCYFGFVCGCVVHLAFACCSGLIMMCFGLGIIDWFCLCFIVGLLFWGILLLSTLLEVGVFVCGLVFVLNCCCYLGLWFSLLFI